MNKYEKLNNDQKELVKHWIEKLAQEAKSSIVTIETRSFTEKHLTPEPVIEVGKWRKSKDVTSKFMVFIESFETPDEDDNTVKSYGFSKEGDWMDSELRFHNFLKNDCIEATPEEVKERLIKEAKKRGFIDGVKTNGLLGNDPRKINGNFFSNDPFTSLSATTIGIYGKQIFGHGKWADIIDEKAEVKDEIDSITKRLKELKSKL